MGSPQPREWEWEVSGSGSGSETPTRLSRTPRASHNAPQPRRSTTQRSTTQRCTTRLVLPTQAERAPLALAFRAPTPSQHTPPPTPPTHSPYTLPPHPPPPPQLFALDGSARFVRRFCRGRFSIAFSLFTSMLLFFIAGLLALAVALAVGALLGPATVAEFLGPFASVAPWAFFSFAAVSMPSFLGSTTYSTLSTYPHAAHLPNPVSFASPDGYHVVQLFLLAAVYLAMCAGMAAVCWSCEIAVLMSRDLTFQQARASAHMAIDATPWGQARVYRTQNTYDRKTTEYRIQTTETDTDFRKTTENRNGIQTPETEYRLKTRTQHSQRGV